MEITDFLDPQGIVACLQAADKRQALQTLAARAAQAIDLPERMVFDTLIEREWLGSTGIGRGIAIPHGKLARLDRIHGLFARLGKPIEFDAIDNQPVDLIFLLLAPESAGADHLKALACVSRLLGSERMIRKLRTTKDAAALFSLMSQPDPVT